MNGKNDGGKKPVHLPFALQCRTCFFRKKSVGSVQVTGFPYICLHICTVATIYKSPDGEAVGNST